MSEQTIPNRDSPPACPVCSRQMGLVDPSKEVAYWACGSRHDPVGVALLPRHVDDSFTVAMHHIRDTFGRVGVSSFDTVEAPADVPGLVTDLLLDQLQTCCEHKQMRQRKSHDTRPGAATTAETNSKQATLGASGSQQGGSGV